MFHRIDKEQNRIIKLKTFTLSEKGYKEREHLQEWVVNEEGIFGEDLLFIQKEFDGFEDTKDRLDLLALDKKGRLVVIELKADGSGKEIVGQAQRYASFCSSLKKQNIIEIFQQYLNKHENGTNAEEKISEFFYGSDINNIELNEGGLSQRIILVAGKFRKEVTSTVMWLMNFGINIQCFEYVCYCDEFTNNHYIDFEQIIPPKAIEDYIIKMAEKTREETLSQNEGDSLKILRAEFWKLLFQKNDPIVNKLFKYIVTDRDYVRHEVISRKVGYNIKIGKKICKVDLWIDAGKDKVEENDKIYNYLLGHKEVIEKAFGSKLIWYKGDGNRSRQIIYESNELGLAHEEDWEKMCLFLIENIKKMNNVFSPYLQKIELQV